MDAMQVFGAIVLGIVIGGWMTFVFTTPPGAPEVARKKPTMASALIDLAKVVDTEGYKPSDIEVRMPLEAFMHFVNVDADTQMASEDDGVSVTFIAMTIKGMFR